MRIITADETGLVKVVRLESGECLAVSKGEQARANAVRRICFDHSSSLNRNDTPGFFSRIHVARLVGAVETWDVSQSEREGRKDSVCDLSLRGTAVDCPAAPVALSCLPPSASGSGLARVLTCNGEGEVQIVCPGSKDTSNDELTRTRFSIRGPVSAAVAFGTARGSGSGLSLAAGGKENDLKLWDMNSGQCTWKAKNVPHDFLDMRQPVWITSLCPLGQLEASSEGGEGSGPGPSSGSGTQLVAGTAHRQVRLYDVRAQKRPTHSVDADEHGVTTMLVAPGGREVVVADTAGLVRVLDLRKMKWGRRFEGPAGSVRGLAFHPTLPVLACVGLDRMARVYDYRSREQKFQVYLKQRLNAVLFDREGEVRLTDGADNGDTKRRGGAGSAEAEGWSGSEGWGSEEEYEMDDADSSSEEEEQGEGGDGNQEQKGVPRGGAGGGRRTARGRALAPAAEAAENGSRRYTAVDNQSGERSSDEDDEEDEESSFGGGDDEDSEGDSESESDEDEYEEKVLLPPSKRRSIQKTYNPVKKTSRR